MRKAIFGVVIGALVFSAVALAATQSDQMKFTGSLKYSGHASKKKPKNARFRGILHVSTADNKQPDVSSPTELFFPKQLKNNGKKFKGCAQTAFDGKGTIPKKCSKAVVGGGTANALVGKPGNDPAQSLAAAFTVKVINGLKGKQIFLALIGPGTGNVYRAIPGKVKYLKGKFGYKVTFRVPQELQTPVAGSQAALTDFDVKINSTRKVKVKHKKVSFFQVTSCPKSHKLPVKAVTHFHQDDNSPGGPTVSDPSTMKCH